MNKEEILGTVISVMLCARFDLSEIECVIDALTDDLGEIDGIEAVQLYTKFKENKL